MAATARASWLFPKRDPDGDGHASLVPPTSVVEAQSRLFAAEAELARIEGQLEARPLPKRNRFSQEYQDSLAWRRRAEGALAWRRHEALILRDYLRKTPAVEVSAPASPAAPATPPRAPRARASPPPPPAAPPPGEPDPEPAPDPDSVLALARRLYARLALADPAFRYSDLAAQAREVLWGRTRGEARAAVVATVRADARGAMVDDLALLVASNERRQVSGCWVKNQLLTDWLRMCRTLVAEAGA